MLMESQNAWYYFEKCIVLYHSNIWKASHVTARARPALFIW